MTHDFGWHINNMKKGAVCNPPEIKTSQDEEAERDLLMKMDGKF